jgi:hypothetical protein
MENLDKLMETIEAADVIQINNAPLMYLNDDLPEPDDILNLSWVEDGLQCDMTLCQDEIEEIGHDNNRFLIEYKNGSYEDLYFYNLTPTILKGTGAIQSSSEPDDVEFK